MNTSSIGCIGLGRMGMGVANRLVAAGHTVIAFNRSQDKRQAFEEAGGKTAASLAELVEQLPTPRVLWLSLPSGSVTSEHVTELLPLLAAGDCIIDSANGDFRDSMQLGALAAKHGVHYLDCGISGGIIGATKGYCLMVGGDASVQQVLSPIWQALAQKDGYVAAGPIGAGHYTKMVHNAIEYGMMQAFGEGIELLGAENAPVQVAIPQVLAAWQHGSVVESLLGDLAAEAAQTAPQFEGVSDAVADSGEGRWALREATQLGVPTPVLAAALHARFTSQGRGKMAMRVLSHMRALFGGHPVR